MESKSEGLFSRLFATKRTDEKTEFVEYEDITKIPTVGKILPQILMSYTKEQEESYSEDEKIRFEEILASIPPLRIGEVNFVPFEAGGVYGGYFVRVIIRNGRDLDHEYSMTEMPLGLIDATGEIVAVGLFKPQDFGELRFGEARVWTFAFHPSQVRKQNADFSQFTIALP